MKKLHGSLLRSLPGPFFAAFGTLVFLLLLQFLIVNLKHLVGRGLPLGVIGELIAYSLAYMVSLAVPMSMLLATLMVFGRLAESQAYAVAKGAGVSLFRLTWPVLVLGGVLVGGMAYFNNVMLPEANHRMRGLWQDIRTSKPGFELEPGVFYDGLQGYAIRVDETDPERNTLSGVLIYDFSRGGNEATIVARQGELVASPDGQRLVMTLTDGEVHRTGATRDGRGRTERYERIAFARHRLALDLSDLAFERGDRETLSRTTRTMRSSQLWAAVDSMDAAHAARLDRLRQQIDDYLLPWGYPVAAAPPPSEHAPQVLARLAAVVPDDHLGDPDIPLGDPEPLVREGTLEALPIAQPHAGLEGLPAETQRVVLGEATTRARSTRSEVDAAASTLSWDRLRSDRYRIEVYKKNSMALACFVFVLVGIPLGLAVRRRGYGWALVVAAGLFLFYWMTLVQGEKLGVRGILPPWLGMWAANLLGGPLAALLFVREGRDPAGLLPRRRRR
jgi:lipopolysaccharide export system permease protein